MKVIFRSNDRLKANGFKARWSLVCGGIFEATEVARYIVSPNYPYKDYNHSLNCVYHIVAQKSFINVVFEDFSLETCTSAALILTMPYVTLCFSKRLYV